MGGESHVSNPTAESELESDSSDRLSELPDSLILSILSFLEMEDVVTTTILSKRWKDLWTTVPILDFNDAKRSFIEGALSKWKGDKILKFSTFLCQSDPPLTTDIVDSWLFVPIEKQVEDLFLYLGTDIDPEYCLPQPLYSCSSITKLSVSSCNLKIEENVNVRWNHLKSLDIEHDSYLSEDAMNRIISGAHLLEELRLLSLEISENLNIQSTSLKRLKMGRDNGSSVRTTVKAKKMLRIWAPNLLSLEISGYVCGTCLLDVPSLTNAVLCFEDICLVDSEVIDEDLPALEMFEQVFRSIGHAEKVTLSDFTIVSLLLMEGNDVVVQFSNTKFLKLCMYHAEAEGILPVLDMFPELMTLVIELHEDYYYPSMSEKSEVDVFKTLMSNMTYPSPSLHQLKTVEISWCICDASIFLAIETLLRNARLLDKMVFRPKWSYNQHYDRKLWLKAKKKVLRMLKSSPTAKVVVHKSSFGGTLT